MDIGYHGTNITSAVFLLDLIDVFLAGFIEIFVVTLVDRVDLTTRRQGDLWFSSMLDFF